jgi:hypothetical protein
MTRKNIAILFLMCGAARARADSDPTTISAQGDALSRSESPVSLTPVMPSGPPAPASAGAPVAKKHPARAAATAVPVSAAPSAPAPAAPMASSTRVVIMDARDTPGKIVVSQGGRGPVLAPGDALITDRKDRHIEILPDNPDAAAKPAASPEPAEPSAVRAQAPPPPADAPAIPAADPVGGKPLSHRNPWPWVLGAGAAVFAAGYLVL